MVKENQVNSQILNRWTIIYIEMYYIEPIYYIYIKIFGYYISYTLNFKNLGILYIHYTVTAANDTFSINHSI